jgi:ornithine decarboxylase
VEVVGVSFHVGSGCMSPDAFVDALHRSRRVFDLAESMGLVFEFLDLGGGFLGTFEVSESCFETVAAALSPVLDELFPASSGIRVIAEPGRYMVSETSTLVTRVTSRRVCTDPSPDAPERLIYQNDGVYGSFNCMFFDHYMPVPIPLRHAAEDEPLLRTTIFGPTCDSLDCIVKSHPMIHLEEGDTMYYKSMGAYTRSAGSCFNGMPLPSLIYVHSSS